MTLAYNRCVVHCAGLIKYIKSFPAVNNILVIQILDMKTYTEQGNCDLLILNLRKYNKYL